MMKNKDYTHNKPSTVAFTLAEVLLTLAIIGVVAALTIPAVITKVTKDRYVSTLKKSYNTLKSVEREAVQENGEMRYWVWTDTLTDFDRYFKPHFEILKDCGTGNDDGCFGDTYYPMQGTTPAMTNIDLLNYAKIVTADGISVGYGIYLSNSVKSIFIIDVNGKQPPNRYGRDLFVFGVYPEMGINPHGAYYSSKGRIPSSVVDADCKTTGNLCTAKVLAEGAMNY